GLHGDQAGPMLETRPAPCPPGEFRVARTAGFFLPPGRPKAKSTPLGGSKPKAQRGGFFFAAGPPQGKKRPLGGQQAEGAAWGLFLPGAGACRKALTCHSTSLRSERGAVCAWPVRILCRTTTEIATCPTSTSRSLAKAPPPTRRPA